MSMRVKAVLWLLFWGICSALLLLGLQYRGAALPPLGELLDPLDGVWHAARVTTAPDSSTASIPGLSGTVRVLRDERGVPHIFAEDDFDAMAALGYVVAQDRLFQLTFIPRAASGRLSEVFGPATIDTDRFLRALGLEWGAQRNYERIRQENGTEWRMIEAYTRGVNAYIEALEPEELPLEFRLLGYAPEPYTPLHSIRLLQYMTFDLAYRRSDAAYARLRETLAPEDFELLFPSFSPDAVPIVPDPGRLLAPQVEPWRLSEVVQQTVTSQLATHFPLAEGFIEGKGSNNWAVDSSRSTTGAPILAGDMHLSVTMPAIWYEAHLVTPSMNTYGVTIPGAPLPVEAYNESHGWAFTNTGGDVVDRYRLQLTPDGRGYYYEGEERLLEAVPDTIRVKGGAAVTDTLYYSHWGPVTFNDNGPITEAIAMQWTAHKPNRALQALWEMHHADSYAAFEDALRSWDTPMQNILYADTAGTIAIRSTGFMPIRRQGHGIGILDGRTDEGEWIGRVPFDALPHSVNPSRGFLTSTNQMPTDASYPYYFGHDWRSVYRSIRADQLLRSKPVHSVADLMRYQADVHAVQRDLFVPLLDTLGGLSTRADILRTRLLAWDGETTVDRPEPLILDVWLDLLNAFAWDEPVLRTTQRPGEPQLWRLLQAQPTSPWLDVQATEGVEDGPALLRLSLEAAADTLTERYGWEPNDWRWGDHHRIEFLHLTRSEALRPLWRGPYAYPGFASTLSPARGYTVTHSASWRMVVDFSQQPPQGYGVYPGGQSGNPLSPLYDAHLEHYLTFGYYDLYKPSSESAVDPSRTASRLMLQPER